MHDCSQDGVANETKRSDNWYYRDAISAGVRSILERRPKERRLPGWCGTDISISTETPAKRNRWGHRDSIMILVAYRHGFRAAELVDLRWDQRLRQRYPACRSFRQRASSAFGEAEAVTGFARQLANPLKLRTTGNGCSPFDLSEQVREEAPCHSSKAIRPSRDPRRPVLDAKRRSGCSTVFGTLILGTTCGYSNASNAIRWFGATEASRQTPVFKRRGDATERSALA